MRLLTQGQQSPQPQPQQQAPSVSRDSPYQNVYQQPSQRTPTPNGQPAQPHIVASIHPTHPTASSSLTNTKNYTPSPPPVPSLVHSHAHTPTPPLSAKSAGSASGSTAASGSVLRTSLSAATPTSFVNSWQRVDGRRSGNRGGPGSGGGSPVMGQVDGGGTSQDGVGLVTIFINKQNAYDNSTNLERAANTVQQPATPPLLPVGNHNHNPGEGAPGIHGLPQPHTYTPSTGLTNDHAIIMKHAAKWDETTGDSSSGNPQTFPAQFPTGTGHVMPMPTANGDGHLVATEEAKQEQKSAPRTPPLKLPLPAVDEDVGNGEQPDLLLEEATVEAAILQIPNAPVDTVDMPTNGTGGEDEQNTTPARMEAAFLSLPTAANGDDCMDDAHMNSSKPGSRAGSVASVCVESVSSASSEHGEVISISPTVLPPLGPLDESLD
eukprot:TRINITY_DN322_c0_g1_i1.p1 TRINITY_DN322_c0_g1~~TRINITY_DN322_c0_g1_i1.p1  ORF type:complete len:435 (-),score=47.94 TRINITY_DN322_c0_g1_i1:148-1452(-)